MRLGAWIIYLVLQLVWLPISIIASTWVAYKQINVSKRLGLSQTAIEIINGRWTGDVFGLRTDPGARALAPKLKNNSTGALWLALFPLRIAKLIAGQPILYPTRPKDEDAGLANLVFSRSPRFDNLIDEHTRTAEQFVLLGAGLDTRAYPPKHGPGLRIFELDQATEQKAKRASLDRAKIDSSHVTYIEADFSDPNWIDSLTGSEFDPSKPSIFLWEGVTLYLTEAEVRRTLEEIKSIAAPGSVLLLDIYAERFAKFAQKGAMAKVLDATDEAILFNLDFSEQAEPTLAAFAASNGYAVAKQHFLGSAHKKGAFAVVAAFQPAEAQR